MIRKLQKIIKSNKFSKFIYDRCFDIYFDINAFCRYCKSDKRKIKFVKESAKRERCFIIGNGPSLRISDLNKLINEDTFAVNRVFRIFDKTNWRPTYYVSHDTKVLQEIIGELDNVLGACKFIFLNSQFKGKRVFNRIRMPYYFYAIQKEFYPNLPCFSEKLERGLFEGYTVVYSCIQLAVYMGYKEIYLLGLDHNYNAVLKADGTVLKQNVGHNYMDGVEGETYFLPQLDKTELAYLKARKVCEEKGIIIKNATRGGKLEIFERINFDDLFGRE